MTWGTTDRPGPPDRTWIIFVLAFVALIALVIWHPRHGHMRSVVINNDPGGYINAYAARFAALKQSHEQVRVEGVCVSACTMVLGLPRDQVCAGPNAVLGFHAGSEEGVPVPNRLATFEMTSYYPRKVREWFYSRPLSLTIRYVRATKFLRPC